MAFARYTFLPWLRRGAANSIKTAAMSSSRAMINVSLALSDGATTGAPIEKSFALTGPGDIIGINPDLVVRTEPRAWVTDFEPNHLAFIEFYDEDFCWRHTPAPANAATHRLDSWITLLVLAEGEFERNYSSGRPLSSVRITVPNPASFFPDDEQLWAWAHVHITGSLGAGETPDQGLLADRLTTSPDSGVCRLVSPRRLKPNTAYWAFVVPSFEVGRKAGLGLAIDDATESGVQAAWAQGADEHPVYYEWYFRSGESGDFEDLVQRMQARPIDPRVGVRDMDIAAPGFGMPVLTEAVGPQHHKGIVGLEGALKAPTMQPKPLDPGSSFPTSASAFVNAPAIAQKDGDDDPVVAPPLMGGWHARLDKVDPAGMSRWLNELNLDPRSRAAGGLGARVVRANQERYMKLSWDQVGEVLAANRRVANLQFAQVTANRLFERTLQPMTQDVALSVTAPVFGRVRGSPQTLRGLLGASRLPAAAMSFAFRKLTRPRGLAMKRALPAELRRGAAGCIAVAANEARASAAPAPPPIAATTLDRIADQFAAKYASTLRFSRWWWVIVLVLILAAAAAFVLLPGAAGLALAGALGAGAAATVAVAQRDAPLARSVRGLALSKLTPADLPRRASRNFVVTAPPADASAASSAPSSTAASTARDATVGADFLAAQRDFTAMLAVRSEPAPVRAAFDARNAHAKVMAALTPSSAYPRRAAAIIRVGDRSITDYVREAYPAPPVAGNAPRIVPVMAYPDIKDPMYAPLAALSNDLLTPNLGLVPPNTISLMLTNPPFIEAYMAGVNHEFARELLWREYPTDCRGSPFRQFWNVDATPTPGLTGAARAAKLKDIMPLHEWSQPTRLGTHANPGRGGAGERVVLVIRGDLLKRYPNTIIYAQRARWGQTPERQNDLVLYDEIGENALAGAANPNFAYPIFHAPVAPDLNFVGFDLLLDDVRGDPTLEETAQARTSIPASKLGWFFVLQEVLGEPRFGLDENAPPVDRISPYKWDNFSWPDLKMGDRKVIDLTAEMSEPSGGMPTEKTLFWSEGDRATAADIAGILYQKPVMVAWHGRQMLERGKVEA